MTSLRKTHPILKMANNSMIDLPAPSNLSHFWNFGSLLGLCLVTQTATGIFLAMHFSADISIAFNCIDQIMRDVNNGWVIRLIHANGASLFFFAIYLHIGRGLYFNSYILLFTWWSGVILFFLAMMTAFLGYVLPWGQMSYWGATVITNLLSAIPYLGQFLVEWVWGGFSVNNATLMRFFSLHFFMPFAMMGVIIVHLIFLHDQKSSNPLGLQNSSDKIPFHPYYSSKDLVSAMMIFFLILLVNKLYPFSLMDPENFTPANPLSTPTHIQPEWYFLFAYAILRAIPNKLGGVLALLFSIIILMPLSLKKSTQQMISLKNQSFWWFIIIFIILTWLGMKPVEDPFITAGALMTFFYFTWFMIIMV